MMINISISKDLGDVSYHLLLRINKNTSLVYHIFTSRTQSVSVSPGSSKLVPRRLDTNGPLSTNKDPGKEEKALMKDNLM